MRKLLLFIGVAFYSSVLLSQVGIGTTEPTPSAMLEIKSTVDGGNTYKGFMPPRVPNTSARDAISPSTNDIGLEVFVEDIGCLQIFNGAGWESIHCINSIEFSDLFQNFDLNTTWGFTSDVSFFDNGNKGFYGITNSSNGGFSSLTTLTNDFLGIMDLNDTEDGNGTSGFAYITFNNIDVSAASNGTIISFDYEFYEFDNGDDAYYTVTIDGIAQPEVLLINGVSDLSISGSVQENIPPGTLTVGLQIRIKQDGQTDYAGFDNFALVAN